MGSRLGKYTQDNTKCMLPIHRRTLIERALDALLAAGVRECVLVVGYQKQNVMDFVGTRYKEMAVSYVANDIFNTTNNIYSLYLAREHLVADDTILLESDLIFEERILSDLIANPAKTCAVVAPWESWMDGTVTQLSDDATIVNFIPSRLFNFNERASYYKTVNIYKFSREFSRDCYVPFLEAYCAAMGRNEYYEQVLRVISLLDKQELKAHVLGGEKWYEIDDAQDKDIAEALFCETDAERLRLIGRRYGGYWRFPRMLDFCYLVNPYFPCARMQNEMKAYFNELLAEYPSGLAVQNLLAAKLFNINEENILVGNGAAELIRALAAAMAGGKAKIGVIYPSFNEYPESFELYGALCVPLFPSDTSGGFRYTLKDTMAWQKECDALLLINPDNPSGNYLCSKDVRALLDEMKAAGKRLILDESFIDFADAEDDGSLLKQDVLECYPNLVLIKSLSKSYGVPGARLGVLASSDCGLIGRVRKHLSIWNINSFAEYFLQIIGKYQKDYRASCARIAGERRRFAGALAGTGLFDVYPSQANYLLCRAKNGTAGELAEALLAGHEIFIKDLTGKKGIPDGRCLRLAVRGEADNNRLLAALSAGTANAQAIGVERPEPRRGEDLERIARFLA